MFSDSQVSSHQSELKKHYHGVAEAAVTAALQSRGQISYDDLLPIALCVQMTSERDLKALLKRLGSGPRPSIRLLGLAARERVPNRKKGHRVEWLEGGPRQA